MTEHGTSAANASGTRRALTIELEPAAGSGPIDHWLLVWVGKGVVLSEPGDEKRVFSCTVPPAKTAFELHALGRTGAEFVVTVNLPELGQKFSLTCTMPATHLRIEVQL